MIETLTKVHGTGNMAQLVHDMKEQYEAAKEQSIELPSFEKGTTNDNRWAKELGIFEEALWGNILAGNIAFTLNTIGQIEGVYYRKGIRPKSAHDIGKYHVLNVLREFACFAEIAFA